MKFQTDLSRQTKIAMSLAATVIVMGFGFVAYSYLSTPSPGASRLVKTTVTGSTESTESLQYQQQLTEYNASNANAAITRNKTYLSVPSLREETNSEQTMSNPQAIRQERTFTQPNLDNAKSREQAYKNANEIVKGLQISWQYSSPALATTQEMPGYSANFAPATGATSMATTNQSIQQTIVVNNLPTKLIEAFQRCSAELKTNLDTDVNSVVEATLWCKDLYKAKLMAPGYKLVGNNIDLTFTTMVWQGGAYKINAKPVDSETGRTMLTGDVNNRYFTRIVLPAVAMSITKGGQLYENANGKEVVVSDGVAMQSTPDKVSNNQLYGAFIGGLASHTGNVLKADAARVPPKQVTREGYSTIGVIFLEPVMSSDRMDISKQTNAVNTQQSVQATATQDYSQPAAAQQIQDQQQALQLNEAQQAVTPINPAFSTTPY
ncbi:conjugal transfer protein TraO [Yersinia aldovae]|uniref:conjugal transfer protein TraO n=1 Tax=Yersinia aldovae TaxID=29483 RepID=UPI0011A31D9A|nr:conjugal transfer protein TraO [Yersinia aldovae]